MWVLGGQLVQRLEGWGIRRMEQRNQHGWAESYRRDREGLGGEQTTGGASSYSGREGGNRDNGTPQSLFSKKHGDCSVANIPDRGDRLEASFLSKHSHRLSDTFEIFLNSFLPIILPSPHTFSASGL